MKEIRLCWSIVGRTNQLGEPVQGGIWYPDSPDSRRDYEVVMDAGNEQYGDGTHWIEEPVIATQPPDHRDGCNQPLDLPQA